MEISLVCIGGPKDGFEIKAKSEPRFRLKISCGKFNKQLPTNSKPPYELYKKTGCDATHTKKKFYFSYVGRVVPKPEETQHE